MINETLGGVQDMVEGMNRAVHSQLDWVVGQLGGANHGLRYSAGDNTDLFHFVLFTFLSEF